MFPQQQLSWLTWKRKLEDQNQTGIVIVIVMVIQLIISLKITITEISRPIFPPLYGRWHRQIMFLSPGKVVAKLDLPLVIVSYFYYFCVILLHQIYFPFNFIAIFKNTVILKHDSLCSLHLECFIRRNS